MNRASYIAAAFLAVSLSSFSAAQTFAGTTAGAPTWNRPLSGNPPTSLSAVGTAVPHQSTVFSVSTNGSYTFNMDAVGTSWDTFAFLYTDPFNAATPLTNVLIGDDDSGPGSNSQFTFNLTAGTQYVFVGTGFANTDSGAYNLTVAGPGTATFGAVPEPASLSALALGGFALLRRRRASK